MEIKLKQNQQQIVNEGKLKCGNWQGCGSGKTLTHLMMSEGTTLVVTPKNLYEQGRWYEERDKFGMDNLTIKQVSVETFKYENKVRSLPPCDTLIIDEAHVATGKYIDSKDGMSNTLRNILWYIKEHNPKRIYLLSGSIHGNKDPIKIYAVALILGIVWNFEKFREFFYYTKQHSKRTWLKLYKRRNTKECGAMLEKIIRQTGYVGSLHDFNDVPEQVSIPKYFTLSKEQRKQLKENPIELHRSIENGRLFKKETKRISEKEEDFTYYPYYEAGEKDEYVLELAEQNEKLIVIANYSLQVEYIANILIEKGYTVFTLNGKTKDRSPFTKQGLANTTAKCICVIQASISEGYDLNTFPVAVAMSHSSSSLKWTQFKGRLLRGDNLKKNLYISLVTRYEYGDKRKTRDQACYETVMSGDNFTEKALSIGKIIEEEI